MLKHYYKPLYIIFCALFLNACTTPVVVIRQPLTPQNKSRIHSTRLLLNSTQREIVRQHNDNITFPDSGAIVHHNPTMSRGVIEAIIIAGVQESQAESALISMAAVRNAIEDFDFLKYFNAELKQTVAKLPWLKVRKQEIKYNLKDTEANIVATTNENTTLFVGTTYALNSVFRQLIVTVYVALVQKPFANKEPQTLYANNFIFINCVPKGFKTDKENKAYWINNNGAILKAKLRDAAVLLSNLIATDIGSSRIEYPNATNTKTFHFDGIAKYRGSLIKKQMGYSIFRLDSNVLFVGNSDAITMP